MKKIALLLAAAMAVSAPLVAATSTQTYAAAKSKSKAKAKSGEARTTAMTPGEANSAFSRALGDLIMSFGQPWPASDAGKGKTKRSGSSKSKKGGGYS